MFVVIMGTGICSAWDKPVKVVYWCSAWRWELNRQARAINQGGPGARSAWW